MANKLPGFMFYPGDWMKDPALRRCSAAARGLWMDLLCLMFECEDRGVLSTGGKPWSDADIAAVVSGDTNANLALLDELLSKGVCSRNQAGAIFSRRMTRDVSISLVSSKAGKKGGKQSAKQKRSKPKAKLKQNTEYENEDESVNEFEFFWEIYPSVRKGSKAKAREAWAKATLKVPPEEIIAAAREYAASPVGRGQFSKMPATWLNGECWDDDRESWQDCHRKPDRIEPQRLKASDLVRDA